MPSTPEPGLPAAVPVADPLGVFVARHRAALPKSRGAKRFNAGEHAWLGSRGAALACQRLLAQRDIRVDPKIFDAIARRDGRELLQYGELVALSGDFYPSPEALFEETPSPLPWLWEDNDLSDVQEGFRKELCWIRHRLEHAPGGAPYPDENLRYAWNAKSFVELALRNVDHFGWHNACAYARHHAVALELAVASGGRENETFRRALYVNAFADHFLTDGFAAGHIRVPRAEICAWADAQGLGDKVAGALSKLLHDQDGHVDAHSLHGEAEDAQRPPGDGLKVRNAKGDTWLTYCDGQLFLERDAGVPAVQHAADAVADSVFELLLAWQRRELPAGPYAATQRVPFPHPEAPTLVEKFPATMPEPEFERLWASLAWYARVPWMSGLQRQHVRALFAALPQIMTEFRANVAAAETSATVRLSPGYVAAYRQVA